MAMGELPPPPGYRPDCQCNGCNAWRRWSAWDRLARATVEMNDLEWPGLWDQDIRDWQLERAERMVGLAYPADV